MSHMISIHVNIIAVGDKLARLGVTWQTEERRTDVNVFETETEHRRRKWPNISFVFACPLRISFSILPPGNNMERSCRQCHSRKVRCSRTLPCAACSRLRLPCEFPASTTSRVRASNKISLADRLARLEQDLGNRSNKSTPPSTVSDRQSGKSFPSRHRAGERST
jgi:hypothetical protein